MEELSQFRAVCPGNMLEQSKRFPQGKILAHTCLCIALQILRLNTLGKTRRMYVKRRDLLRANGLQPRDLRRIDPSQGVTKTSPNISIKEHVLVINLGGVRWIKLLPQPMWVFICTSMQVEC